LTEKITAKHQNIKGVKMKHKFKITKVEVQDWFTDFSITQCDHPNKNNLMSAESFFHRLGGMTSKKLSEIEGLEFTVELNDKEIEIKNDSLELCGKILHKNQTKEKL